MSTPKSRLTEIEPKIEIKKKSNGSLDFTVDGVTFHDLKESEFVIEDCPIKASQKLMKHPAFQKKIEVFKNFELGQQYYQEGKHNSNDLIKSFTHFYLAARKGHRLAQLNAATMIRAFNLCNREGQRSKLNIPNPEKKYFELMTLAAGTEEEPGHPQAQYYLGTAYFCGHFGAKQDNKKAFYYFKLASKKNSEAQFLMGHCLENGLGTPRDLKAAFDAYLHSSVNGNLEALNRVGQFYEQGLEIVEVDFTKACTYYEKSSEKSKPGKRNYAHCLLMGRGTSPNVPKAIALYKELADQGDVDAQQALGSLYHDGHFIPKEDELAFHYMKLAADQERSEAEGIIGGWYLDGIGTKKNFDEAFRYLTRAAERGESFAKLQLADGYFKGYFEKYKNKTELKKIISFLRECSEINLPYADYLLGLCHISGFGTKKDPSKAFKHLQKAAQGGEIEAEASLGLCYLEGIGVEKDEKRAVELYTRVLTSEPDNINAINNLASCLMDGLGVERNRERAFELLSQVKDKASPITQKLLGFCHKFGWGTEVDLKKSAEYLIQAATQDNLEATTYLGGCYLNGLGVPKNLKKALEAFHRGAEANLPFAKNALGVCQIQGLGCSKNYKKGFKNIQAAAEKQDKDALNNLGWCYLMGYGVSKNYDEAIRYFVAARDKGHLCANLNLAWCRLMGYGVPQHFHEAMRIFCEADANPNFDSLANCIGMSYLMDYSHSYFAELEQLRIDQLKSEQLKNEQLKTANDSLSAELLFGIAQCYLYGFSVPIDRKRAVEILMDPLIGSHYEANALLANCFMKGIGVPACEENVKEGFKVYLSLLENYPENMNLALTIANFQIQGLGTPVNYKMGHEMIQLGIQYEYGYAYTLLGWCYENGLGVEKDVKKAVEHYRIAADKGCRVGMQYLGHSIEKGTAAIQMEGETPIEGQTPKEYCRKAAELDNAEAIYNLATYVREEEDNNYGDLNIAFLLSLKSAKLGYVNAQICVGMCYEVGSGIEQDRKKALEWYKLAREAGHPQARGLIMGLEIKELKERKEVKEGKDKKLAMDEEEVIEFEIIPEIDEIKEVKEMKEGKEREKKEQKERERKVQDEIKPKEESKEKERKEKSDQGNEDQTVKDSEVPAKFDSDAEALKERQIKEEQIREKQIKDRQIKAGKIKDSIHQLDLYYKQIKDSTQKRAYINGRYVNTGTYFERINRSRHKRT